MNKIIATAAIFILATSAAAEEAQQKETTTVEQTPVVESGDSSGYYTTLNAGESYGDLSDVESVNDIKKNGFAAAIYGGYAINRYAAVELGYLYLPSYKYADKDKPSHDHKLKNQAIAANIVGTYPLAQGFSIYGKLGTAYVMGKDSGVDTNKKNGMVLAYGAGVDYALPMVDGLHVDVDYYHLNKKSSDKTTIPTQNIVSIGVRYKF